MKAHGCEIMKWGTTFVVLCVSALWVGAQEDGRLNRRVPMNDAVRAELAQNEEPAARREAGRAQRDVQAAQRQRAQLDARVTALEAEKKSATRQERELASQIDRLQKEQAKLEADHAKAQSDAATQRKKLEDDLRVATTARDANAGKVGELEAILLQARKESDTASRAVSRQLADVEKQKAAAEKARSDAEARRTTVEGENAKLSARVTELERSEKLGAAVAADHAKAKADWSAQSKKLEQDLRAATAARDVNGGKVAELEAALQLLRKESDAANRSASDDLAKVRQQRDALQVEVETWRTQSAELDRALTAQQRRWRDETTVRRGEAMREKMDDPYNPALAWSLNDVALLLASEGRSDEAEVLFRRALAIIENHAGRSHAGRATVVQHLADVRWQKGDLSSASILYRDAVETFGDTLGAQHPRLAAAFNGWATVLRDQGRLEDAERIYRRSIETYETRRGRDNPDIAAPLHNLGLLLVAQQRYDEAGPLLIRSARVVEQNRSATPSQHAMVMRSLAQFYAAVGNLEQAMLHEQKAGEWAVMVRNK